MIKKTLSLLAAFGAVFFIESCSEDDNRPGTVLVESIEIEGDYIQDGGTSQMTAIITPSYATNREVEWSVSDETIAAISETGLLTAVSNGNLRVVVTAMDGSEVTGSKLIAVEGVIVPPVLVESITIVGQDITDGLSQQLEVEILPEDADNQSIEWSVSDEIIALITEEGRLLPRANGAVTVTAAATDGSGISQQLEINVSGVIDKPDPVVEDPYAFPGAEGFGRDVTGGRGGQVIYVTNLNDSGTGSLRNAINTDGPRYILFKVSGTIRLNSRLSISKGDVTIAGQTAPGDGITIRDYPVYIGADNVVIRFMRFRMGDAAEQQDDPLGARYQKNIIIDHCSMSWSVDECTSFYVNENTTVQWSFITESLRNSVHDKGAHGYGGIWGGKKASFHHNLLAHHSSRNPRLGDAEGTDFALTDLVDLRNNVIYNWSDNSCYGGEAMNANIVNCYYKPGPATSSSKTERIIAIDYSDQTDSPVYGIWGKFYIDGNVLEGSTRATDDNWTYGVYNQFHGSYGTVSDEDKAAMRLSEPHNIENNVTTHSAQMAYDKVLEMGGASLVRDAVDLRIVQEVSTGTYTYTGSLGSTNGIIDSQEDVGGWPELNSEEPPVDTSNDGIPDEWKLNNWLDPSAFEANGHDLSTGYENIEVYLHSLVKEIIDQHQ